MEGEGAFVTELLSQLPADVADHALSHLSSRDKAALRLAASALRQTANRATARLRLHPEDLVNDVLQRFPRLKGLHVADSPSEAVSDMQLAAWLTHDDGVSARVHC